MKPPVKREWPKMAHGPLGNSAVFACRGDVPHGWTVVGEKPRTTDETEHIAAPKNKGGRPKKVVVE